MNPNQKEAVTRLFLIHSIFTAAASDLFRRRRYG
jgi:hypothetical protein